MALKLMEFTGSPQDDSRVLRSTVKIGTGGKEPSTHAGFPQGGGGGVGGWNRLTRAPSPLPQALPEFCLSLSPQAQGLSLTLLFCGLLIAFSLHL